LRWIKSINESFNKNGNSVNSNHLQKAKVLFIIVLVLLLTCQRPSGPPPGPPPGPYAGVELRLEQLSVTCTEAWLKVSLAGVDSADQGSLGVELKRNDTTVDSFSFLPPDTIIRDFGLQPGRSYRYRVMRSSGTGNPSPEVTVTTLDTTSHDFVWEIDTLGNYGSFLNDVWIVNENDIWVVGDIVTDSGEYNAARWDGNKWRFFGIYSNTADLYSILYFSEDDIWVTSHCFPIHWDGHEWSLYHLQNMGLDACVGNAIWGSSPDDVYFVGGYGSIVHWDGEGFEKLESGTDQNLNVITGFVNYSIGFYQIFVSGWNDIPHRGLLLGYNGDVWRTVWDEAKPFYPDPQHLEGTMWCSPEGLVIAAVGGYHDMIIAEHSVYSFEGGYVILAHDSLFVRDINGNGVNDFFLVGDFGHVVHYNGMSFRDYPELRYLPRYTAIGEAGDYVFICGFGPIVLRGVRVP